MSYSKANCKFMKNQAISPAASILILRKKTSALEVLMVKRSSRPPFGNLYVFPGGKIDEADFNNNLKSRCHNNSFDDITFANIIAAIRETFEEVGILLASDENGDDFKINSLNEERFSLYRKDLLKNTISILDILKNENLYLDLSSFRQLSNWITPELEKRRFDTRFFLTIIEADQIATFDKRELTESLWINPSDAIDAATNGEMPMIPPTIKNLEIIKECNTETELINCLENRHEEAIKPILPKIYKDSAGNWNILMPDDDGYDEL
jgi:8-oxo-dGTP pyrophosphatase MutT (NUDIX family)